MKLHPRRWIVGLSLALSLGASAMWVRGRYVDETWSWTTVRADDEFESAIGFWTTPGGFAFSRSYPPSGDRRAGGRLIYQYDGRDPLPDSDVDYWLTESTGQQHDIDVRLPGLRFKDFRAGGGLTAPDTVVETDWGPFLVVRRRPPGPEGPGASGVQTGYIVLIAWRAVVAVTILPAALVGLGSARRWARRRWRSRRGRCGQCGYDLYGLVADPGSSAIRCPECGATIARQISSPQSEST